MPNSKDLIRAAMAVQGITQEELAKKMGYKYRSGISNIICGNDDVMVNTLVRIMKELDCDVVIYDRKREGILGIVTPFKPKKRKRVKRKLPVETKSEEEIKEEIKEEAKVETKVEIPVYEYGKRNGIRK